jgi:DNA-binding NtrC family response regulator
MSEGLFREDVFYRINVFPIVIPPLRERAEDIPLLARELLAETSKRLGCPVPVLSPRGMAKLVACSWPGNVRELSNTIERELIVVRGRSLEFSALPSLAETFLPVAGNSAETFNDGARRTIQYALDACGGRIYGKQGAAARLGIPPSTLQGKMKRLRMTRKDGK